MIGVQRSYPTQPGLSGEASWRRGCLSQCVGSGVLQVILVEGKCSQRRRQLHSDFGEPCLGRWEGVQWIR